MLLLRFKLNNVKGKQPSMGETIEYTYTDSQHQNPLNRVIVAGLDNNFGHNYDKEKYKEMLLDAGETVLDIFGLDSTLFGKSKDNKWWLELRRNKMNDV